MMFHDYPTATIEIGSIGWEDDDGHFDLGDKTNDGFTLVKVQLFRGRDVTQPLNPKRAQGIRLTCHIDGGRRIPPKDTRCYVVVPPGMEDVPGAGLIVGTVEKTLDGRLDGDRAVLDYGDQHVVIKGKSVTIQGNDGSFVGAGEPRSGGAAGVAIQGPDGSGLTLQDGVVGMYVNSGGDMPSVAELTVNGINIVYKGGAQFVLDPTGFALTSPQMGIIGPSILALGAPLTAGYKPLITAFMPGPTPVVNPQILVSSAS